MTALTQALINRASKIDDFGSLASVVMITCFGLLVSLCLLLCGLDIVPY